jgi:hypothetical protein
MALIIHISRLCDIKAKKNALQGSGFCNSLVFLMKFIYKM